ncbi:hypothetical protein KCP78_08345 [Salmonella enterica subsp. enterica]|nr:hypothetical protein KCP78_08345 [Salmonella enterica subsp. enterica]
MVARCAGDKASPRRGQLLAVITSIYSLLIGFAIYNRAHLLSKKICALSFYICLDIERQEKYDAA